MTSHADRPDHREPRSDRDPRGDRDVSTRDLVHPNALDDRDRSVAFRNPGEALPAESLRELASILARAYLRDRTHRRPSTNATSLLMTPNEGTAT